MNNDELRRLFAAQMRALTDKDLSKQEFAEEVKRAESMAQLGHVMLKSQQIDLQAIRILKDEGYRFNKPSFLPDTATTDNPQIYLDDGKI
jgi:hypothetical protein